jgi:cytochrome d ubiquinol oxidase subunit I
VLSGVLGVAAMEAGWVVTEVGRQPWIIYNVMTTASAVTPAPGIWITFSSFVALYVLLGVTLVWLLLRLATGRPIEEEQDDLTEKKEARRAAAA